MWEVRHNLPFLLPVFKMFGQNAVYKLKASENAALLIWGGQIELVKPNFKNVLLLRR